MGQIEAVFKDGVFKPLGQIALPQNQRVRLTVESVPGGEVLAWLEEVRKAQQPIVAAHGFLPDSARDCTGSAAVSDVIVDSSVVAKWILPEADSAHAQQLLVDVVSEGGVLVILDLALVEVTNAIWKQRHRNLVSADEATRLLDFLLRIPVRIEPAGQLLAPALDIAIRHGRAVYDALFVALVQQAGLPGVTADEPLYNAVHSEFSQIALLRHWHASSSP